MRTFLPRFLVLGGRLPDAALSGLAGLVELVDGADPAAPADGGLLPANAEVLPALRRYREGGGRLPIFAVSEEPIDIAQRLRWIRQGADDLLEARTAAETLARKLRSDTWRQPLAALDPSQAADRVDRWLRASSRYLDAREELVGDLGNHGRSRFLDASFLRDQVVRAGDGEAAADPFGQRRGSERESLNWPVRLLAPVVADGHLQNIGADGVCLALPTAPGPGERLQLAVSGERVSARVELEVRWQRRIGRGRWQIGAFGIACTIERGT